MQLPFVCFSAFVSPLYAKMIEYKTKNVIIRQANNHNGSDHMHSTSIFGIPVHTILQYFFPNSTCNESQHLESHVTVRIDSMVKRITVAALNRLYRTFVHIAHNLHFRAAARKYFYSCAR